MIRGAGWPWAVGPAAIQWPAIVGCVEGIAFLLYVRRDHKQGFPKIHGLADRLETCGGCISTASSQTLKEGLVVQTVERKRLVHILVGAVPEETQRDFRMPGMPLPDVMGKTSIEEVTVDGGAPPFDRLRLPDSPDLWTKKRRHDMYLAVRGHIPETQGQDLGCPQRDHVREHVECDMSFITESRELETAMLEKELVSQADHWSVSQGKVIGICAKDIVEIDDHIRAECLYPLDDEYHRWQIGRKVHQVVKARLRIIRLAVIGGCHEIDALELLNRGRNTILEELWQDPRRTFSYEHPNYFMSRFMEEALHRHGLRQMPPSLALYYEEITHYSVTKSLYLRSFHSPESSSANAERLSTQSPQFR